MLVVFLEEKSLFFFVREMQPRSIALKRFKREYRLFQASWGSFDLFYSFLALAQSPLLFSES